MSLHTQGQIWPASLKHSKYIFPSSSEKRNWNNTICASWIIVWRQLPFKEVVFLVYPLSLHDGRLWHRHLKCTGLVGDFNILRHKIINFAKSEAEGKLSVKKKLVIVSMWKNYRAFALPPCQFDCSSVVWEACTDVRKRLHKSLERECE